MTAASQWPLQSQCKAFYGDPGKSGPSAKWEAENLVLVRFPWQAYLAWAPTTKCSGARVHKKCAASLNIVFASIWNMCGKDQKEIERIGMHLFGGGYIWRPMRNGASLSMHSYGCALDFDPAHNAMGDQTPAMDARVVAAFQAEGWTAGIDWKGASKDSMHFQAARVS